MMLLSFVFLDVLLKKYLDTLSTLYLHIVHEYSSSYKVRTDYRKFTINTLFIHNRITYYAIKYYLLMKVFIRKMSEQI